MIFIIILLSLTYGSLLDYEFYWNDRINNTDYNKTLDFVNINNTIIVKQTINYNTNILRICKYGDAVGNNAIVCYNTDDNNLFYILCSTNGFNIWYCQIARTKYFDETIGPFRLSSIKFPNGAAVEYVNITIQNNQLTTMIAQTTKPNMSNIYLPNYLIYSLLLFLYLH